ncbi:hypothetical protein DEU56DRAFT_761534 [Suillus clintonianus]|uniref:uncharacterized protein n=1 Tax=Suillus clintonianus TaxID=1904413 RepID=UPI001B86859D|nr:uncharacterized protein DEU56DRAFT_761534 [Suillus clintonianus]KAG2116396.1 hypothetical protein DEU56DRAFT_761534 [Suillus clintonianus]
MVTKFSYTALLWLLHLVLAQDPEANFAWAPLAAEPQDGNLEELVSINNAEVLGGKAFDFFELERVDQGIVPQAAIDEVDVVNHNSEDDGWDDVLLMSSVGLSLVLWIGNFNRWSYATWQNRLFCQFCWLCQYN